VSAAVVAFTLAVGATSVLGLFAGRFRSDDRAASLEDWTLAGRRFGTGMVWFLLGGSIYTAYTFVAVPGLVYGAGGLGFFALPYTVILLPIAFVVLPRMWQVCAAHGYVTVGDYVRGRYGSPGLALVIALTGILATMPYVALQLVGIRAALTAAGLYPPGPAGDAVLVAVFAVLAVATFHHGVRAPALISIVKAFLVFAVLVAVLVVVVRALGGVSRIFVDAGARLAADAAPGTALVPPPSQHLAYVSLALGSALALVLFPHILTAVGTAASADVVRRTAVVLPAWTLLLGMFGLLGLAALADGVDVPSGRGELAVPLLVNDGAAPWLTGLLLAAVAVGALVPAAVMSVALGALFTRNVYLEYLNPAASPARQARVARWVSLMVKVGAVAFVVGLRNEDAINLQLLGGVWILQTLPSVAIGLFTRWLHRGALMAGWAAGMALGTALVVGGGFAAVVDVWPGPAQVLVYAALAALALNLVVAVALSPLLDRAGVARGVDATALR
jgi:solute:Na+ symporter, SSS family